MLSVLLHALSYPVPQLSLCLSITLLLGPFLSLRLLIFHFPFFSVHPVSVLFVLQASELGMTSAFYKYILTTMVRAAPAPLLFFTVGCAERGGGGVERKEEGDDG